MNPTTFKSYMKECLQEEPKKDCPEDWGIAAFIMNELDAAQLKEVADHISRCGYCMDRAAVYYKAGSTEAPEFKTPEEWTTKAARAYQGDRPLKEKASLFNRLIDYIQDIIESLPPLPGYAVAAVSVILLIWFTFSSKQGVVTIASSQRIVFKDTGAPTSFGFMGRDMAEAKDDMEISVKKEIVVLNWKAIGEAKKYSLSVKDRSTGEEIVPAMEIKEPIAFIPLVRFKKGELYKWNISGNTVDGREFNYTGEFVLAR